ncbi:SLBB domain-containing protein [Fructobacillus americanaquae]|uniref:SLBB domain-containing protein n=1 Tax=Fructobacillus americanaquae TaxID=2940302 RepID=A0ABY5C169_9LACO|nr:SLBB domain-containing protein [Fructobacillus americanaquae]USS91875.1 SLBB domain-containing protein [Fructobacillus americanaquae]
MMESLIDYWRYLIVAGLGLLAVIVVFFRLNLLGAEREVKQNSSVPRLSSAVNEKQEKIVNKNEKGKITANGRVMVDLKGAVNHQGVVDLPTGSRLQDAIQQAGGLTDQADRNRINLAQLLVDGQALYIEQVGEEGPNQLGGNGSNGVANASGVRADVTAGSSGNSGGTLVNLNTASAKELETLAGIGPKKASRLWIFMKKNTVFSRLRI